MDAMIILAKQGSSGCMKVKERSYHIEHGIKYTRTVAYISISFTGRDQRGKRVEYARAVEGNFSLFSSLVQQQPAACSLCTCHFPFHSGFSGSCTVRVRGVYSVRVKKILD
jgi:hypothetical protein